ncbi:hypothetical protein B0T21DRAFT_357953 [Apiosordaria backusii]|uniref:Uncharacterized protein n=1 Tax=Apiosordaria backusii TaxID=314023 RepID=A0AA40ESC5_9PEZI|nr:hypothetical protein B0T21DRAFT_357953 [Apiosordaria backusii]
MLFPDHGMTRLFWPLPCKDALTHLFLNLMPDFKDSSLELSWAKTILNLTAKAGQIRHVVYLP